MVEWSWLVVKCVESSVVGSCLTGSTMLCPCARHFIPCYCGNVVNAFMKKGAFKIANTKMRRRKTRRLIRVYAICHAKDILGNGGHY